MPVQIYLKITAIITALLGIFLIIMPAFIENHFVINSSHGGDIFIRFLGSTLFGYACLNWLTASHDDHGTMHATILANLATLTVAFVISLIAELNGTLSSWGWLIVLLHFVFGSGFAFYARPLKIQR